MISCLVTHYVHARVILDLPGVISLLAIAHDPIGKSNNAQFLNALSQLFVLLSNTTVFVNPVEYLLMPYSGIFVFQNPLHTKH